MTKFQAGDKAYIVENNRNVREVTVVRCSGGIYLIKFENGGGIQVKEHRLFATENEAAASIPAPPKPVQKRTGFRSPYDYEM